MNKLIRSKIIRLINILALLMILSPYVLAKEVTDQLGRKIRVPDNPKRVISLAPSITEIIFAIKQEKRLVAATRFSDYPEQAKLLPKVGSYVQLDLERIISLTPDLCIAVKDGNPIDIILRIESFGIPVFAVDPQNFKAIIRTIHEIGMILNAPKKNLEIAKQMEHRMLTIKSKTSKLKKKPRVFFQIGISPIVSVGTKTFIHELITIAGGTNITSGTIPYPRLTKEEIISLSPEIFIITSMARQAVFQEIKKEWQQWTNIPAIRNNRIHLVDSSLFDRAAPRLADGMELLFQLIHPDIWKTLSKESK